MRITCPSCSAEYNVPDTLAAGRSVRCAKCGTKWAPVAAPVAEVAPPPVPEPEPEPPPPPLEPPARLLPPSAPPPVRRWPLPAARVASALVIVAALAAAFVFREPIMQKWPPSQRVYGVLGLRGSESSHVQGNVVE